MSSELQGKTSFAHSARRKYLVASMQPIAAGSDQSDHRPQKRVVLPAVRPARRSDLRDVVGLQMSCLPYFLWSEPGPEFLRLFYALLLHEQQGALLISEQNCHLGGFVAGVTDFTQMRKKLDLGVLSCLSAATRCLLSHPMHLRRLVKDLHKASHFGRDFSSAGNGVCELITIAVEPHCRRRGHGTALVRTLIDTARRSQARQLRVSIESNDQGMSYFFRRLGFEPSRTFKGCGSQWMDEYTLRI
jgi:ribosomal protein S18 acetylase RimI-like enzyme